MAIYRKAPTCPYCGEVIATAIYRDQSKIPFMQRLIGDTFIRWEYKEHRCEGKIKADEEAEKEYKKYRDEAIKKGTLPPFFK